MASRSASRSALLAALLAAAVAAAGSALAESDRVRQSETPRIKAEQAPAEGEAAGLDPAPVEIAPMTPGDTLSRSVEGGDLAPLEPSLEPEPADTGAATAGPPGAPAIGQQLGDPGPPLGEPSPLPEAGPAQSAASFPVPSPALPEDETIVGSPLPAGLVAGLDPKEVEESFARIGGVPRSPVMHGLWQRLLAGDSNGSADPLFALRLEGLTRAGLIGDAARLAAGAGGGAEPAYLLATLARVELAEGRTPAACALVKRLPLKDPKLAKEVRADGLAMAAYCAASSKDPEAAKLGSKVLAGAGVEAPTGRAVLEALAAGKKPVLPTDGEVTLVDEALLRLVAPTGEPQVYARATPEAAYAALKDPAGEPLARAFAGEAAARALAIGPGELAALYRAVPVDPADRQNPLASTLEGAAKRAILYQAVEAERSPLRKARNVRAFLDEARRDGLYMIAAQMMAEPIADLPLAPDIAWFAETAIEIDLAGGRYRPAAAWAEFGSTAGGTAEGGLLHWLTLVDIADANGGFRHGSSLPHALALAQTGGLPPELLQRLATVLDALQYDIPIPLWELASRGEQSESGHLPETGLLTALQQAASNGEVGRTILLGLRAIGPGEASTAHLIALGDTIRSLKAAGLEIEARRLAFEALFADWPRRASG